MDLEYMFSYFCNIDTILKKARRYVVIAVMLAGHGFCADTHAHPGGLNAEGCHNNRKTGEYHCHKQKKSIESPLIRPIGVAIPEPIKNAGDILRLDYDGFTIWLDCSKRGPVKFQYNAQRDTGNAKRDADFYLDPNVPKECQQLTSKAYGNGYDRGHQVPANHLDASASSIKQTNYMTNILPQTSQMNRGAWLGTEEIVECYRDIDELLVIGGVIWGNNLADDYFLESHGVQTPDAFWKVIIRGAGEDEKAIAWIVPNSTGATRKNLDKYLVSVEGIERITGEKIPVADYVKHDKPEVSWILPMGCDKS